MKLEVRTEAFIRKHAKEAYPHESCGVVIVMKGRQVYRPCKNLSVHMGDDATGHFVLDPADYAQAEDAGEIIAVVHSHPGVPPEPSVADQVSCGKGALPWVIVNWPTGAIKTHYPDRTFVPPLVGRDFVHGAVDCLSLVRDYYAQKLGIGLPDCPEREDDWWDKGQNLYLENYERAGLELVYDMREHDIILFRMQSSVPNHSGVLVDGGAFLLHHLHGRLSSRDFFGQALRQRQTHILRHPKCP